MERVEIKVKKLDPLAILPKRASERAAGADICALLPEKIVVEADETVFIHTGLAIEVPDGYAGFVFARSGLAAKNGLAPANKVGVIDSDYRGELIIALLNHGAEPVTIIPGQRVAQLVVMPVAQTVFAQAQELSVTERGEGGFGSTGA